MLFKYKFLPEHVIELNKSEQHIIMGDDSDELNIVVYNINIDRYVNRITCVVNR